MLIENPNNGNKTNVPTNETGTAHSGISVARQPCKKMKTTKTTSASASNNVFRMSRDTFGNGERLIERDREIHVGRETLLRFRHELAAHLVLP